MEIFFERLRPDAATLRSAIDAVRSQFPAATSSYTADGAIVHDEATDRELGSSGQCNDYAVDFAWMDAFNRLVAG